MSKTAIVTGSSRGLGAKIAQTLIEKVIMSSSITSRVKKKPKR